MKAKSSSSQGIRTKLFILIGVFAAWMANAEILYSNEFWISTNATGNLYPVGGSIDNPLDGSTEGNFDYNLGHIPPYSTIHIMPGTYQVDGDGRVRSGQKIIGSGIDVTIVRIIPSAPNGATVFLQNGVVTNVEISDLTADANYISGNINRNGVDLEGTMNAIRRVKVVNTGAFSTNVINECGGVNINNYSLPDSEGNVIEDCEVLNHKGGDLTAIGFAGGRTSGENGTGISGIVRNNKVILQGHGAGLNFSWTHDVLVEGNYVEGAGSALYGDTGGSTNLTVVNNTFKDSSSCGVFLANSGRNNMTFAFNTIELAAFDGTNAQVAFALDGWDTNILIFGNNVLWKGAGGPPGTGYFLNVLNIKGFFVKDNRVDPRLINNFWGSETNNYVIQDNYDLNGNYYFLYDPSGNYLPNANHVYVGSALVSSLGFSLVSSANNSSALTSLGLPADPAVIVTNSSYGVALTNTLVNGVLTITNSTTIEPWLTLKAYIETDYLNTADSAAYIDSSGSDRRVFIGSPSRTVGRLNMVNVGIGEDFPPMWLHNQTYFTDVTDNWTFVSSDRGSSYLGLVANSAGGFLTGQRSVVEGGHRSLAFKTFSDTNDPSHVTGQYVFDTAKPAGAWFSNQVYWSWRIGGVEKAKIDTNASWFLTAPVFSVSGNVTAGTFTGDGGGLTNLAQKFVSIEYPLTNVNYSVSTNHGLSTTPQIVRWVLVCKTNELGYTVGDEVAANAIVASTDNSRHDMEGGNSTKVFFAYAGSGNNMQLPNKTNPAAPANLTAVSSVIQNWKLKCYATYVP